MPDKDTLNKDSIETRQLLQKNHDKLDGIHQTLEKILEAMENLVSIVQREDFIFAPPSRSKLASKSSLISNKSVPSFDFNSLNPYPDLKDINEELIRGLQDQTKQNLL
ncbi:MAG: hypothetical protein ACXADA_15815, partial [Candidatus Hodarchaeales archaeon]